MKLSPYKLGFAFIAVFFLASVQAANKDPLSSWNDSPAKTAIISFVDAVTDPGSLDYVEPKDRIAVFDNDGTLWVEQPTYTQAFFLLDSVKDMAAENTNLKEDKPLEALLDKSKKIVDKPDAAGLISIEQAASTGVTVEEYQQKIQDWIKTAKHPELKRPFTELVYQPQLELLNYLRDNGFKTFIVSGGGIEFMRAFTEDVYGIPPEQVIGSSVVTEFDIVDGKPVILRKPEINFIDDKAGKPVGIHMHIGKRPIIAVGNSDSDKQMIQYTMAGDGARLGLFVHHTDEEREYAYDRESSVGTLDEVLDIADENGWIIIDMKEDWNRIFPNDK